jgi:DNA-binding IclR family transcriptional regulator
VPAVRPPQAGRDGGIVTTAGARDGKDRTGVQVLARAAAILRRLAGAHDGMSATQLAADVGLPRTTVHRICHALEQESLVSIDPVTGRLHPGPGLLSFAVTRHRDLHVVVGAYLERLSRELNETVDLAVLDGTEVLFIAQHAAPLRVLMAVSRVGARFPAHCTSNGKALLAQLPPGELKRHLPKKLEIPARDSVNSLEQLLSELEEVRTTGLAFDREEHRTGICAVGVAITDVDGSVASITVPMPAARFYEDQETVVAALVRTRDEIQAALNGG